MTKGLPSWGLYPKSQSVAIPISPKKKILPTESGRTSLPYGLGRSYGDSCLNNENILCPTKFLDMFLEFNDREGVLKAQSGVSLKDILDLIVPRGWFLPVSPGTKYVTLGGAVANDIHGKNHHTSGCFGNHVIELNVTRTNGERIQCSRTTNDDFFAATIGGLGLTGLITDVTFKLKKIESKNIIANHTPFESLAEFFDINQEKEKSHEYTVAWIDTLNAKGRGIYIAGNHADDKDFSYNEKSKAKINIPTFAPNFLLNPISVKIFNETYYQLQKLKKGNFTTSIDSFFYPLDGVGNWNRLYGKRGFFQYQCVIPGTGEGARNACLTMLESISKSKQGSFLAVLKTFGSIKPLGLLSFPKNGITVALDFPNNGSYTTSLFQELDQIVKGIGGRIYPAKDAQMSAKNFKSSYHEWGKMLKYKDPNISSSFWRRVTE
jgi:FAD/FMN-containing dehydrogenase